MRKHAEEYGTEAENIFDLWAETKIEQLENIVNRLEDYIESDDYANGQPKLGTPDDIKSYLGNDAEIITDEHAWDEIISDRNKAIKSFIKSGNLSSFSIFDYDDILEMGGEVICILEDCKDLIERLQHRRKANNMVVFFSQVQGWIDRVTAVLTWIDGRYALRLERKELYETGPGATSAQAGKWTMDAVRKVLEKYGGYRGYKALPYGRRGPVIDEIATAIKAKDGRNVYNIIKKIGVEHEGEN
jgi:hypothetical protein